MRNTVWLGILALLAIHCTSVLAQDDHLKPGAADLSTPIHPEAPVSDECDTSAPERRALADIKPFRDRIAKTPLSRANPTLAIIVRSEDTDKVENFLVAMTQKLQTQVKTTAALGMAKKAFTSLSRFFQPKSPSVPDRTAPLFSASDLQLAFYADARSKYGPRLQDAWRLYQDKERQAEKLGSEQGATRAIDESHQGWTGFFNMATLGLVQRYAAMKGREEGEHVAKTVVQTLGPPEVVQQAEKEIMDQAQDEDQYIMDLLKKYSEGTPPPYSFSLLVTPRDFSANITSRDANAVRWANGWAGKQAIDASQAAIEQRRFRDSTNDASMTISRLTGRFQPGFYLALISPSGKITKVWDGDAANPQVVASKYLELWSRCATR